MDGINIKKRLWYRNLSEFTFITSTKKILAPIYYNTKNGILDHNYLQYLDFSKIYDIKKQFIEYEKDRHTEEYGRLIELYLNRYDKRLSTPDDILGYLLAQKETAPSGKIIAIIGI